MGRDRVDVQITACGSFALEVPRRNLRSFSLVSGEKVYNLESDWERPRPSGHQSQLDNGLDAQKW